MNISSHLCTSRFLIPSSLNALPGDSIHFVVTVTPSRETAADLTRLAQALSAVRDVNVIVVEISKDDNADKSSQDKDGNDHVVVNDPCSNGMIGDILVRNRLPWTHIHAEFEG